MISNLDNAALAISNAAAEAAEDKIGKISRDQNWDFCKQS